MTVPTPDRDVAADTPADELDEVLIDDTELRVPDGVPATDQARA